MQFLERQRLSTQAFLPLTLPAWSWSGFSSGGWLYSSNMFMRLSPLDAAVTLHTPPTARALTIPPHLPPASTGTASPKGLLWLLEPISHPTPPHTHAHASLQPRTNRSWGINTPAPSPHGQDNLKLMCSAAPECLCTMRFQLLTVGTCPVTHPQLAHCLPVSLPLSPGNTCQIRYLHKSTYLGAGFWRNLGLRTETWPVCLIHLSTAQSTVNESIIKSTYYLFIYAAICHLASC